MKLVINLEIKNITKSSLAYERVFLDYLLGESEQIYWILNLEGEVHSIWVCGQAAFNNVHAILFYFC